jgi:hypothetical protein
MSPPAFRSGRNADPPPFRPITGQDLPGIFIFFDLPPDIPDREIHFIVTSGHYCRILEVEKCSKKVKKIVDNKGIS